jgi:class 3 adenylate cyclase/tetratricopeptide (TPR) repeat protein
MGPGKSLPSFGWLEQRKIAIIPTTDEHLQLEEAIAAQARLRGVVPDEIIDATIEALCIRLAGFSNPIRPRSRRQVTVLFADLSGSTSLGESIDPEEFVDLLDEIWRCVDPVIHEFGGRIDKHIGDAVMALWGGEQAEENHPEQAVRAALEMQAAFGSLRRETRLANLDLRIGINTGPVVMSPIASTDEFTAIGDTVNTAARLESAAPPGAVLLGHGTYRHVRGVFSVRTQEPLTVKGKRAALRTYLVEAVQPRAFRLPNRGVEGVETAMVGRQRELAMIQDALEEVNTTVAARTVTIFGEASIGKSRLLFEFEDWLRLQPLDVRLFKGRAEQRQGEVPYSLLSDLLFFRFEIAEDDPPATAVQKLRSGIAELVGETLADDVATLAYLTGIHSAGQGFDPDSMGSPQQFAAHAARTVGRLFSGASRTMPVVILMEDLHWADRWSLEVIQSALLTVQSDPILVVGLARRTGQFSGWESRDESDVVVELTELGSDDAEALVAELLQNVGTIPPGWLHEIAGTAAGNPFFVEELVKMMIDDGVIVPSEDDWQVREDLFGERLVPSTITGVIQARLDRLPRAELSVVQRAAVVGRIFWDQAIPMVSGREQERIDLDTALEGLEGREMVFRNEVSAFAGCREYVFKHSILQEVAYETVIRNERRSHHREVGDWLARWAERSIAPRTVAGHYEAAGAEAEAALWFALAGRRSLEQYALDDAVTSSRRALAADVLDAEGNVEAFDVLCESLLILAQYNDALEAARDMEQIAERDGSASGEVLALLHQSASQVRLALLGEALETGQRAQELFDRASLGASLRMDALTEFGWLLLRLGRTDEAREVGQQARLLSGPATDLKRVRNTESLLGATFSALGSHAIAEEHLAAALEVDRKRGDRRSSASDLLNLGELARLRGDFSQAVTLFGEAWDVIREIGDRDLEALALNNLGGAFLGRGDLDMAVQHLADAIRACEASGRGRTPIRDT